MDTFLIIISGLLVLSFLVVIHEGGHYLAARAFGVRVTEFMVGLPGPNLGFLHGETRFGITPILLGGYARVCGMDQDPTSPYLREVLASIYRRGTADMEDVAADCGITPDEAYKALEELYTWGCVNMPKNGDEYNTFRTMPYKPTRRQIRKARAQGLTLRAYAEGEPRTVLDPDQLYESERQQQYHSLPFWKRSVILLAGPGVNVLYALIAFVLLYSVIGFDYQFADGTIKHVTIDPLRSIQAGFTYIGMVVQAVVNLFNPATFGDTVSNSTSVVGIAVMSKSAIEQGFTSALSFTAMISVSLAIMNLIPIPPLDGGRFIVEFIQKITRRQIPPKVINIISVGAMVLMLAFFAVMVNQDIQRFVFGNW